MHKILMVVMAAAFCAGLAYGGEKRDDNERSTSTASRVEVFVQNPMGDQVVLRPYSAARIDVVRMIVTSAATHVGEGATLYINGVPAATLNPGLVPTGTIVDFVVGLQVPAMGKVSFGMSDAQTAASYTLSVDAVFTYRE